MISSSRLTPFVSKPAFLKTDPVANAPLYVSYLFTHLNLNTIILTPQSPSHMISHYFLNNSELDAGQFYFHLFWAQFSYGIVPSKLMLWERVEKTETCLYALIVF